MMWAVHQAKPQGPEAGLCPNCIHVRIVKSARESVFFLCNLSKTNPAFEKYPRFPVLRCWGYEPAGTRAESANRH